MSHDEPAGFRPLFTEAPLAQRLLTTPSAYDAAPTWMVQEASAASPGVRRAVAQAVAENTTPDTSDLKHQALLAVQLVAPIGLNIVRIFGLGSRIAGLAVNPVAALLSAPALFFTGKRMARDLRRALVTDPKVRALMERADRWMEQDQPVRAADLLREALDQDLHPEYARNGDLYLKLGVAWMAARRPRLAMVAFARASVLFDPEATVPIGHHEQTVKVNKRGLTEMMALAALDSFARDDKGLAEWAELGEDFGRVARRLLDETAARQEAGYLWGAFGTDEASADACRELSAKVGFLVAKLRLASDATASEEAFQRALDDLQAASLEADELQAALLEQATFYCTRAMQEPTGPAARRATQLLSAAASASSGAQGVMIDAQAARFGFRVLEAGAGTGPDGAELRDELSTTLCRLGDASRQTHVREEPMGKLLAGWTAEQQYRLTTNRSERRQHIQTAYTAWMKADEPVSAMRAALRLAWAADAQADVADALAKLEAAARRIQSTKPDAVSTAFAARALLDVAQLSEEAKIPAGARSRCAELFLEAAQQVASERSVVPFYVGDRLVMHGHEQAKLVLKGLASYQLARDESLLPALALLADIRHHMDGMDEAPIQLAMDLERAAILQAAGEVSESRELLEEVEKEARIIGSSELQRRALELLNEGRRDAGSSGEMDDDAPMEDELLEFDDDALLELDDGGPLEEYSRKRAELLRRGREIVSLLTEAGLADRLRAGEHRVVDSLTQRLERIENARFRIAIAGEFSAGKSTLLNALLHEPLLPVSVRPTTAVINRLQWSAEPFTRVIFEDGRSEEIEAKSLRRYVTEKGNPSNERQVSEVVVGRPIELLRHGAEIIDTPGLSSMVEAHGERTRALLPTLDALVLVATARQPFGASTGRFLDEAGLALDNKVFYVLNKRDQVASRGLAESIAYAQHEVGERVRGSRVIPVSAYARLAAVQFAAGDIDADDIEDDPRIPDSVAPEELEAASGLNELETELGCFLQEARGMPLLRDCARRTLDILDEGEMALSNELAAAKLSAVELRKAFETLAAEHAQRKAESETRLDALDQSLERELSRIVDNTSAGIPLLKEAILRAAPLSSGDIGSEEASAAYGQRLRGAVQHQIDQHLRGAADALSRAITAHRVEARTVLRALQRELRTTFAKELRTPVVPDAASMALESSTPDVGGFNLAELGGQFALGGVIGLIGAILGPVGWILGAVGGAVALAWLDDAKAKKASEQVAAELGLQLERLADEVRKTMGEACDRARSASAQELNRHREELLAEFDASLESLLDSRSVDDETLRTRQATLRGLQHRAQACRKSLTRIARTS